MNNKSSNTRVWVEETAVGPFLYIGSIAVRSWFGTAYNEEAKRLASAIQKELTNAGD